MYNVYALSLSIFVGTKIERKNKKACICVLCSDSSLAIIV